MDAKTILAPECVARMQNLTPCTLRRSVAPEPTAKGSSDQAIPRHPTIIA